MREPQTAPAAGEVRVESLARLGLADGQAGADGGRAVRGVGEAVELAPVVHALVLRPQLGGHTHLGV